MIRNDIPRSIIGHLIADFIDVWLDELIFGEWGSVLSGFSIIVEIIGLIILVKRIIMVIMHVKEIKFKLEGLIISV